MMRKILQIGQEPLWETVGASEPTHCTSRRGNLRPSCYVSEREVLVSEELGEIISLPQDRVGLLARLLYENPHFPV